MERADARLLGGGVDVLDQRQLPDDPLAHLQQQAAQPRRHQHPCAPPPMLARRLTWSAEPHRILGLPSACRTPQYMCSVSSSAMLTVHSDLEYQHSMQRLPWPQTGRHYFFKRVAKVTQGKTTPKSGMLRGRPVPMMNAMDVTKPRPKTW